MKSYVSLVILLALIGVQVQAIRYDRCRLGASGSQLKSFSVDECADADEVCTLTRGQNVTYRATFETFAEYQKASLRTSLVALNGAYEPYDVVDVCGPSNGGITCPSQKRGSLETLELKLAVNADLPAKYVALYRVELIAEDEQTIVCSQFLVAIE